MRLPSQLSPHLADALRRVSVPSYVLDRDGNIRWLNQAAIDLFGDARGQHFTVLIAPEDLDRARVQFAERMKTGGTRDFKVQLLTADGGRTTVEISSAPMRSSDHAIGVFGLAMAQPRGGQANPHPKHRLTRRQSEVLHLLGSGASTEQMANTLHLSQQTVRNHVRHVLQALGAHSRLQAVAIAHQEGLI